MFSQKRYVAHTYMSSKCDVSNITKQIKAAGDAVSFESFLVKAAAKAFRNVLPEGSAHVSRVL
jgi:hypothetical protein